MDMSTNTDIKKKEVKVFCNGRIRWNLLINFIIVGITILPFFVPEYITLAVNVYYALFWVIFVILAARTQYKISKCMKQAPEIDQEQAKDQIKFIMATFVYKEPLDLILKTLKNVSQQRRAKDLIMVVCMEEKTPQKEEKIKAIYACCDNVFSQLLVTIHPFGVEGEIPGKCSNNNYAIRSVHNHLKNQDPNFNPETYFVTNFDVDTVFHAKFLDIQAQEILKETDRNNFVWQPVLFYNWDLDKLSFFTRITGIVRNVLMMGALIPFNINIMSVYTASLRLYIEGDYCHPAYQMEDIICYIRWFTLTKRNLTIRPIYCPTISGPTSGSTYLIEFMEWARQIRRWSVGTAEVFHYFCIKSKRIGFFKACLWGFNYLNYYAGFICVQGLLMITTTIILLKSAEISSLGWMFMIPLGVVYLCLFFMIVLNKLAVKYLLHSMVVEKIAFYRDVLHWISSLFVMIVYGFIVLYGFWEIVIFGRSVCKHGASKKSDLRTQYIEAAPIMKPDGDIEKQRV